MEDHVQLSVLYDGDPLADAILGLLPFSLSVRDLSQESSFLREHVPTDQAHAPHPVGRPQKRRHTHLAALAHVCLDCALEALVNVDRQLQRLYKKLKLIAVVLQLDTELLVEDKVGGCIHSCDEANYLLDEAGTLLYGPLL
jgi:hypothetical protein